MSPLKQMHDGAYFSFLERWLHSRLDPGKFITLTAHLMWEKREVPIEVLDRIRWDQGILDSDVEGARNLETILRTDGIQGIAPAHVKEAKAPIIYQGNYIRSLRPSRKPPVPIARNFLPFDESKFSFLHPDAAGQDFLRTTLEGYPTFPEEDAGLTFILNRYTYARKNAVIAPCINDKMPQYLDPSQPKHAEILAAVSALPTSKGLGEDYRVLFNMRNANASVNHLHFQGFCVNREVKLPIEELLPSNENCVQVAFDWIVDPTYFIPRNRKMVGNLGEIISAINEENSRGKDISYNLLFGPYGAVLFERKSQSHVEFERAIGYTPGDSTAIDLAGLILMDVRFIKDLKGFQEFCEKRTLSFLAQIGADARPASSGLGNREKGEDGRRAVGG